jgi:glycosyltransferase involved in cell wall biosynthesis
MLYLAHQIFSVNILQLTKKVPWPMVDGETIALQMLSKGLTENGAQVSLLSMNPAKQQVDIRKLENGLAHYKDSQFVDIDNRVNIIGAFKNLFSRSSYHISRFDHVQFRESLVNLLTQEKFDHIILESIYLAPYIDDIRKHSQAKITLRSHNVEYKIWSRIVTETKSYVKRIYLKYLTKKLKRYELKQLSKVDLVASVSEVDNQLFEQEVKGIHCIHLPIGLDVEKYEKVKTTDDSIFKVGFIGSLDWQPNINGLRWFLKEVWPLVKAENIHLNIAGRNPGEDIFYYSSSRTHVLGEIPCAKSFMNQQDLLIVPLFSGSGTRVKILESMACASPVLTTTIGIEGIPAEKDVHYLLADTAEDFAKNILFAQNNRRKLEEMAKLSKIFVTELYDYKNVAKVFIEELQLISRQA